MAEAAAERAAIGAAATAASDGDGGRGAGAEAGNGVVDDGALRVVKCTRRLSLCSPEPAPVPHEETDELF